MKTTHRPRWWNSSWLRHAYTHMGGSWAVSDMDSEPGKSKWFAKENLEEMSYISDLNCHMGAALSLSLWAHSCIYPHVLIFLLINTLHVSIKLWHKRMLLASTYKWDRSLEAYIILYFQEFWAVILLIFESRTYLRILCLDQTLWSSDKSPGPCSEDLGFQLL